VTQGLKRSYGKITLRPCCGAGRPACRPPILLQEMVRFRMPWCSAVHGRATRRRMNPSTT